MSGEGRDGFGAFMEFLSHAESVGVKRIEDGEVVGRGGSAADPEPCPCCGSDNLSVTSSSVGEGLTDGAVRCDDCGLRIERDGATPYDATEAAVRAWNRRVADAEGEKGMRRV